MKWYQWFSNNWFSFIHIFLYDDSISPIQYRLTLPVSIRSSYTSHKKGNFLFEFKFYNTKVLLDLTLVGVIETFLVNLWLAYTPPLRSQSHFYSLIKFSGLRAAILGSWLDGRIWRPLIDLPFLAFFLKGQIGIPF